jgi:hypothetical protein
VAFTITLDYRFDTSGFFNSADRRATLEAAAAEWAKLIEDDFAEIPAGSSFEVSHPSIMGARESVTLQNPIGGILIFVGARSFTGNTLAMAGPTGTNLAGDIHQARISSDFRSTGAVSDFEPWAGQISFDTGTDWHFGMDDPVGDKLDLDPPPPKWSARIVRKRRIEYGNQATQAGRDCHEATAG